jgi:hypothetical protein
VKRFWQFLLRENVVKLLIFVLAIIVMFFGIGFLSTLSASLAALIITHRLKENKGMCAADFENHLIL